jgi:hypothetical protein
MTFTNTGHSFFMKWVIKIEMYFFPYFVKIFNYCLRSVMGGTLIICGKHLLDRTISLRGGV